MCRNEEEETVSSKNLSGIFKLSHSIAIQCETLTPNDIDAKGTSC